MQPKDYIASAFKKYKTIGPYNSPEEFYKDHKAYNIKGLVTKLIDVICQHKVPVSFVKNTHVTEWQCGATRLGVDGVVSVIIEDGSSEVIIKRASGTQKLCVCVNDDLDVKKLFPVFSSKTGSNVAGLRSNRSQ